MTWLVDHSKPLTTQQAVDAVAALYAAFFHVNNKSAVQFDAIDQAMLVMEHARASGLTVTCNAKDPEPPKVDLPLFNHLDV